MNVPVPTTKVKSSTTTQGGNHIVHEKLMFTNFTKAEEGVYLCERSVGGVKNSKSVKVELKRK